MPNDGQISAPLDCRFIEDLRDSRSAVTYEICRGVCVHTGGWAPACHVNCLRLTEGRFQECLKVTAYTFEPALPEQNLRCRWLLENLMSSWEGHETCATKHIRRLPAELKREIAEQLLREYATARLSALRSVGGGHAAEFSISTKVWARFVFVEGVRYITSLSNTPGSDEDLVHVPVSEREIDALYLREDHLGVRQVVLASSKETQRITERRGGWWRSYRVPNTVRLLRALTDVSSSLGITQTIPC